jgi:hypothetical protein
MLEGCDHCGTLTRERRIAEQFQRTDRIIRSFGGRNGPGSR